MNQNRSSLGLNSNILNPLCQGLRRCANDFSKKNIDALMLPQANSDPSQRRLRGGSETALMCLANETLEDVSRRDDSVIPSPVSPM